jgi:hypothetical protein
MTSATKLAIMATPVFSKNIFTYFVPQGNPKYYKNIQTQYVLESLE